MELLNDLWYAVRYNMQGIFFFAAALYFAWRGRRSWFWYIVGLVLQGYAIFGTVLGMSRDPAVWKTTENMAAIVFFVVLAAAAYGAIRYVGKKHGVPEREKKRKD